MHPPAQDSNLHLRERRVLLGPHSSLRPGISAGASLECSEYSEPSGGKTVPLRVWVEGTSPGTRKLHAPICPPSPLRLAACVWLYPLGLEHRLGMATEGAACADEAPAHSEALFAASSGAHPHSADPSKTMNQVVILPVMTFSL